MNHIWIVHSYYDNDIVSIHRTKKEAIDSKRWHDSMKASRFEVSIRHYIKHNGVISEVRKYEYSDFFKQFMRVKQ